MATKADARGKAESEHWYRVPEHKRSRILEILRERNEAFRQLSQNENNLLAAEAWVDGWLYRLSYREVGRRNKEPFLMFMSCGQLGWHVHGRDTVVAGLSIGEGFTQMTQTIRLRTPPDDDASAEE